MDSFENRIQSFRVERLKEQLRWTRWLVPIEAGLLGLTVSLSKLDSSIAHGPPEALRWAWVFLCLSVVSGSLFALSPYVLHNIILKEMLLAKESHTEFVWSKNYAEDPHREIPFILRHLQWASLTCFLISLVLLGLLSILGGGPNTTGCGA
jgi:hypothetical protein